MERRTDGPAPAAFAIPFSSGRNRSRLRPHAEPARLLQPVAGETLADQYQVLRGEAQRTPSHFGIVATGPMRLHHAAVRMPANSLRHMRDLVDQHVRQDN